MELVYKPMMDNLLVYGEQSSLSLHDVSGGERNSADVLTDRRLSRSNFAVVRRRQHALGHRAFA